jgi:hypothetical protein
MAAYVPLRETPQGGLFEPYIPRQAQAQGLQHDEEFHNLRVPDPGYGTQGSPGGSVSMPFPREDAVMTVYDAPLTREAPHV